MTSEEHKHPSDKPNNCNDKHQFQASAGYSRVLIRLKLNKFYKSLSYTAKNIIAVLIQSAPAIEKPFPIVISNLQHAAGCSKASVLRHIPKGEQAGLYNRKNHDAGRKHGSIVTLNKELCEQFLELHSQEYSQAANTNNESYFILFDGSRDQCGQALDLENKTDLFFSSLSNTEKRVFTVISKLAEVTPSGKVHLIIKNLAEQTSCSEVTARRTVKRGQENGLYAKRQHERGPRFGVILELNSKPMERIKKLLQAFPAQADQYQSDITEHDRIHEPNETDHATRLDWNHFSSEASQAKQPLNHCQSRNHSKLSPHSDTPKDRYHEHVLLDRQIENLSTAEEKLSAQRLLEISAEDFEIHWPRLHKHKFGPNQIRQIVNHRIAGDETLLDIKNSLYAAEWELKHETFPKNRKGPCNYLFATLKGTGTWRRPVGFLSPNEQALANAKKEKGVVRALAEQKKQQAKKETQAKSDKKFEAWLATQTPENLAAIDARCTVPPSTEESKYRWRKVYWGKFIYKNSPKQNR